MGRIRFRATRSFHAERIQQKVKGIADTGFVVAFANRHDRHHKWALALARQISEPFLTCEAVLAESAFHLRNSGLVFGLIETELLKVDFEVNAHLSRLAELADRFQDRQPDLADLCLIRMSEIHPRHPVITVDESDFQIYRRHRNQRIPFICPNNS